MEPIQIEFTFTPESLSKVQVHVMYRYLKNGWLKWVLLLAAILYLATEFFFGDRNFWQVANMLIWIPLFLGFWWIGFKWLSRRNFSKYSMLQHPIRYVFSEENVAMKTHASESVVQWNMFQKAEEARDFFLLYQSAFMASPLMKSGFQNETEQERFRQLLRSKHLLKQ